MAKAKRKKEDRPMFSPVVPKNVQDQADKADELIAGKDDADDVIIDKIEDDPVAATNPEPAKAEPAEPAKAEPAKPEPAKPADDGYKHKYEVLQGMFNKSQEDLRGLNDTIVNLQSIVNQQSALLNQRQSAPQAPAPAATTDVSIGINPLNVSDFAGYGDEIVFMAKGFNQLIEMNKRLASQLNKGESGPGDGRIDRIERIVKQTATERYTEDLDNLVPKWREVVKSAEFAGWLQTIDPISGYQFKPMMDYAYNNLISNQAASIIRRFGQDTGIDVGAPVKKESAPDKSVIQDQTSTDPLSRFTTPDETSTGGQGPKKAEYPTAQELKQATDDYAHGKLTIQQYNEISNRFQMGLQANRKK